MDTAHAQSWLDSLPEVPSDQAWLELLQNQSSSLSPLNQQLVKELAAEPSKGLQRQDFHDILYMNSKLGRAEQAEKTITLMQEYNIEPTTIDYNQLMNAYAFNKDVDGTLNTFKRMMKSQRQPDAWSFGIVIKCLTQNRKLNDAFLFYDQMKLLQIPTTQPIISTLIQGCVRVGDFNRAWRLFDHLRTMVARPDEITYSLMISLCAKTGHVERALTLFHEMSQDPGPHGHRLFPLESTFAALIHACAKRPEYYGTAMDLVQQLEEIGYQCDRITYNYLFLACKNHGDLPRARALWKDMVSESVARRDGEVAVVVPDATTYALLLGTYGRMPNVVENLWRRTVWRAQLGQFEKQVLFAKMGLENEERLKQGKTPIDINEWIIQDDYDPDRPAELVGVRDLELEELRLYLLDGMSEDDRLQVCRREALQLCDLIRHRVAPSLESATRSSGPAPLTMTATLLNTFIETMGTYCLKRRAITVYENDFAKYGVEKNSTTYLRTLRALFASYVSFKEMELSMERISGMKTPNASLGKEVVATAGDEVEPEDPVYNIAKAWDVIRDYERFRNQRQFPSRWDELEKKSVRARYQERGITHYDRKTEYVIYKTMILGLTR
jgi:pentatricopeptide repeat protein